MSAFEDRMFGSQATYVNYGINLMKALVPVEYYKYMPDASF